MSRCSLPLVRHTECPVPPLSQEHLHAGTSPQPSSHTTAWEHAFLKSYCFVQLSIAVHGPYVALSEHTNKRFAGVDGGGNLRSPSVPRTNAISRSVHKHSETFLFQLRAQKRVPYSAKCSRGLIFADFVG